MSAADGAIPKSAPKPHNDLPRVGRATTNSRLSQEPST